MVRMGRFVGKVIKPPYVREGKLCLYGTVTVEFHIGHLPPKPFELTIVGVCSANPDRRYQDYKDFRVLLYRRFLYDNISEGDLIEVEWEIVNYQGVEYISGQMLRNVTNTATMPDNYKPEPLDFINDTTV